MKGIVALVIGFFVIAPDASAQLAGLEGRQRNTISVVGEATVQVVPDQVMITVGIESSNKELALARQANDAAVKNVLAAMRGLNVPERNLKTDYLNIETTYLDPGGVRYRDAEDRRERTRLYVARRILSIDLRDLSSFDKALATALDAGGTNVISIQFLTTEVRKYRDQARTMAVRAAREKAELLVREAGTEITGVISIAEERDYGWSSYYGRWWGGWGGSHQNMMMQNAVQAAPASPASSNTELLAPGQLSVTAKVAAVYALK